MKRKHRALEVAGLETITDEIFVASWQVLSETCGLRRLSKCGSRSELLERLVLAWTPPQGVARTCWALQRIRDLEGTHSSEATQLQPEGPAATSTAASARDEVAGTLPSPSGPAGMENTATPTP